MEKQTITFKADEQGLVKTGGITNYASNTVSYIEATFVLGANWTGFDSVRAIWANDYRKAFATVLDSDGKCIVPAEVLARTGNVKVNLVGSIASGGELTDRLTTYPILAVIVDANARVEGDETKPVTPSQFEQFVAIVKDDADRAETAAGNADASAGQAEGYADDAEGYMQRAETAAETAETEVGKIIHLTASAETLSPGSSATAVYDYNSGTLTLGIPQGATGATPNITIGSVTTLEPGTPATATITGTAENPVLNLGIPKGAKGDTGVGIESIYETGTSGAVHTYTILYTNGNTTTFNVTDGQVTNAALQAITGDLANLTTTDKSNLVAAINEVNGKVNDATIGTKLTKTVNGNPIVLDDALGEVKSLGVELTPIQDLHGYSKPWAGGAGKNKFDKSTASVGVNWNGTSMAYSIASDYIPVTAGNKYTFSVSDMSKYTGVIVAYFDSNKTYISSGSSTTFDVTSGMAYIRISIRCANTDTWTQADLTSAKIQLEIGNTATSYEPYSNICPITGHDSVTVTDTGKNIFDGSQIQEWNNRSGMSIVRNDDGSFTMSGTATVTDYQRVYMTLNAGTYTFSGCPAGGSSSTYSVYVDGQDVSGYDTGNGVTFTLTSTQEITFVIPRIIVGTNTNGLTFKPQLERGSTRTAYEPYKSQSKTVTLPHTVYGADVDVTGGAGKEKMAILDMGSLSYTRVTSYANPFFFATLPADALAYTDATASNNGTDKCSAYGRKTSTAGYYNNINDGEYLLASFGLSNENRVYIRNDMYTDANTFKTAMTGQKICYPIATPTDLSTTPTDITLYNGDNVVSGDGDMDMTYVRDIAIVINKIEAQL